jgi:energy-coupling factor transporter ATP-binding protein EcfA2
MTTNPVSPNEPAKPVAPKNPDDVNLPPAQAVTSSEIVDLPRGKELSEAQVVAMARSRPVRWVVIAGPVGSGKTTLVTSLYELFQWNKVPDYMFAGSDTLPAFEERCYLSRTASENTEADTPRTIYDPVPTYLHLKTCSAKPPRQFSELLFTDVSGEMFEHAKDSTDACKELTFLRRAHHFVLLLDSKRSLVLDRRWAMVEEAKTLLQSCLDSKMLTNDCAVRVLWSRFDYFVEAGDTHEHRAFREEVAVAFETAFKHRIGNLKFGEVAARPTKAPKVGFGKGVVDLFVEWTSNNRGATEMDLVPKSSGARESEMFGERHFSQVGHHE